MEEIYIGKKMAFFNNKLFVRRKNDVVVIDSEGTSQIIHKSFYEGDRLNTILGLDKPKNRLRAL